MLSHDGQMSLLADGEFPHIYSTIGLCMAETFYPLGTQLL